jgi:formiminotetrahydrofolate cyclodeaminase
VVALAAGLVAKAARLSRSDWAEAGGAVAQAEALRARGTLLAETDAAVYEEALAVLHGARDPGHESRDGAIADVLARAAEIPLQISYAAADVALLAADVAQAGDPEASADVAVAALLAEAAARSAHHLVAVNLATIPDDERVARGDQLVTTAAAAAKRALAGVG